MINATFAIRLPNWSDLAIIKKQIRTILNHKIKRHKKGLERLVEMLAATPPMGWNSWNTFGGNISESLIRETAEAMIDLGYREAGYEYVVIDDCWSKKERSPEGRLVADETKFPSGIKALSDYIHQKNLKLGIYSCAGVMTCAGYPGSFGYEFIDAQTFAEWDIDYLKYDYCYKPEHVHGEILYNRMALALRSTGRDILFSACNWGLDKSHKWMRASGAHIFRSTGDIVDNFNSFKDIALSQIDHLYGSANNCFNDMDMLVVGMYGKGNVGMGGCTDAEYRSHFALWCLFNSPLMIGCDIRNLKEKSRKLLQNKDLIAINQDPEARPPRRITPPGENRMVFFRMLSNGEFAFGFFNFTDKDCIVTCLLSDIGLPVNSGYEFLMTDVFTGETIHSGSECFAPMVGSHDCKVYRAKLVRK